MTLDLDSTACEVCGKAKQGACYAHSGVLGYHPLVAARADTGEVLHSRMRSGSSQSGHEHFGRETLARVRRLAADASLTVRADAGFFSYDMIAAIGAQEACCSITIPQSAKPVVHNCLMMAEVYSTGATGAVKHRCHTLSLGWCHAT